MRTKVFFISAIFLLTFLPRLTGQTKKVSLVANPDKVVGKIEEGIYGQFLEHLYHSVNGGIWGEVVWNRSFEEMPPRPRQRDGEVPEEQRKSAVEIPRHWMVTGNAEVSADTAKPLNSRHSLKIISNTAGTGISQANFCVRKGDIMRGSLWLRGKTPDGLLARMTDGETVLAEQKIAAPVDDWKEFSLVLNPAASSNNATIQILA